LKVEASIADVLVSGKVRIVLTPIIDEIPFVGGVKIFLLQQPNINFDMGGVASVMDLPGLNGMIKDVIHDQVSFPYMY
jgi:Ca2+-dependent lipid-binding protein